MATGVKTGGGSRKGRPNKVTADVRAAIAEIIQGQAETFATRMAAIKDDKQYCDIYLKLAEFNIPKLSKVEQTVRHAVTPEQMSDAELAAIAGDDIPVTEPGRIDSPSPSSSTH